VIKRREICSVLHRKVAEPHSSVCHRPSRTNVQAMQIGTAVHKCYVLVHRVGSWSYHGRGSDFASPKTTDPRKTHGATSDKSAGALAQCMESPGQCRVPCETPLVVREPRPTKEMDFAPIDNPRLAANGEQRTVNG
jgi:hypothetical protein